MGDNEMVFLSHRRIRGRMLGGSNEVDVARRLSIYADTVAVIVENSLKSDMNVDPARAIEYLNFDVINLRRRHRLYTTLMADPVLAESPKVLAVVRGRDRTAIIAGSTGGRLFGHFASFRRPLDTPDPVVGRG